MTELDRILRNRPWLTENVALEKEPVGMLGRHEALLCYFLARDTYRGSGVIVDAGSFLGKSAYFFAEGLRANPGYVPGRPRIHCFDNFLVNEDATVGFIRDKLDRTLAFGNSTRALFDGQVASVAEMLEIHEGDFHAAVWPALPIEILMVDIAKSADLGKRVVEQFFPNLIPGASLVIQQDYHHPWLPHIHVTMEYLSDYFDLVIPRVDDSAVFHYHTAVPRHVLQRAIDYDFSHAERMALMDRAIARLPLEDRYYVEVARIVLQFEKVHETVLRKELNEIQNRFLESGATYSSNTYFEGVACTLDELEGWRTNQEGDYTRCLELADKVLVTRPNTHNLTMRGLALLGLGRFEESEAQLRLALAAQPASGYAYIALARALHRQQRFIESEAAVLCGIRNIDAAVPSRHYLEMLMWIWRFEHPRRDKTAVLRELHPGFSNDPEYWVLDAWANVLENKRAAAETSLGQAAQLGLANDRIPDLRKHMQLAP